jgi:hypothetical protein
MKSPFILAAGILALAATTPLAAQNPGAALRPDDVFTLRGTQFYLDGKPYAEMSFNKFDLMRAIWAGIEKRNQTHDSSELDTAVARQDLALRSLHEAGFRTIRIFGAPFVHNASDLARATDRPPLFEAIDRTLALCEKNGIQVVFSLGLGNFSLEGPPAASAGQPPSLIPLYADPQSQARKDCYAYLDEIVGRYRNRKSIAMWEVSNELTNLADIGVRHGKVSPTLPQIAEFFNSTAARIKRDDPLRLVSTGGSVLRESAWHLWHEHNFHPDSRAQLEEAYAGYFGHSAIDVVDTHYYELRKGGLHLADSPDGKPVWMSPGDYVEIVHSLGKGAILGEYGTLPSGWTPSEKNPADPTWFTGYHDPNAAVWVQKGVDQLVAARASLAYWWAYQSDRPVDAHDNPVTFSLQTTPDLIKIIADGNRRLKAALGAP